MLKTQEGQYGLGALYKIKLLVRICIVRAQVFLSVEQTGRQNYIPMISIYLYGATLKEKLPGNVLVKMKPKVFPPALDQRPHGLGSGCTPKLFHSPPRRKRWQAFCSIRNLTDGEECTTYSLLFSPLESFEYSPSTSRSRLLA
ncbi:hypothetical protein TNCV_3272531 [Trichonephila clavipes]|nr:hypothetical protein TNCV_3272531 [Trichonephila clavipes]